MEPWDGPASVAFTDGTVVGAVLDRNGLRPGRWWHTRDGLVVLGSEAGVLDLDPATVVAKGRLAAGPDVPGRHRRRPDRRTTTRSRPSWPPPQPYERVAARRPDATWPTCPPREHIVYTHDSVRRRQQTFGYTEEELKILLAPMAAHRRRAARLDGHRHPDRRRCRTRPRLLYDYFHQLFAQVTNPPLDAIREELVTSLAATIGPEGNLLDPGPASCRQIVLPYPVIDNDELAKILSIDEDGDLPGFKAVRVSGLYPRPRRRAPGIKARLIEICRHVSEAIEDGVRILVLSDRDSNADLAPIPSLLLTAAVHQHLVREQTRTQVALIVESGDCREVHHAAVLIGYGAAAVNPYLAFEIGRGPDRHRRAGRHRAGDGGPQLRQGARQGRPEDHVEDGHLDGLVVLRRAGLRGRRPGHAAGRALLHRHLQPDRRRRAGRDRTPRSPPGTRKAYPANPAERAPPAPRGRRRVPVAPRGRAAPVQPGDGVPAPARHPHPASTTSSGSTRQGGRAGRRGRLAARAVRRCAPGVRPPVPIDEVEPASRDRQAVRHRRHVATARSRPRRTRRWPSR